MEFPITIVKEKRKSLSMQFTQSGVFLIKAPFLLKQIYIDDFLREKEEWMSRTLEYYDSFSYLQTPKECLTDGCLAYLGEKYLLSVCLDQAKTSPFFKEDTFYFFVDCLDDGQKNREKLISWYRQCAEDIFVDRVYYYAKVLDVNVKSIRIKELKSRWGSCSTLGNINLNWKLIKAPLTVIDYVIAHECAHLIHMNHSSNFWNCVESVYPEYKRCKSWLNKYGQYMLF